jgi:hypothetical protein
VELLLLLIPIALLAGSVFAFKKFWPSTPETPGSSLLLPGGVRQLTTGQIARGVFWGMWLFWLSQIVVAGVVMLGVLALGGAVMQGVGV